MGDRGGGRESKGGSLRKTKIHAAEAAKAAKGVCACMPPPSARWARERVHPLSLPLSASALWSLAPHLVLVRLQQGSGRGCVSVVAVARPSDAPPRARARAQPSRARRSPRSRPRRRLSRSPACPRRAPPARRWRSTPPPTSSAASSTATARRSSAAPARPASPRSSSPPQTTRNRRRSSASPAPTRAPPTPPSACTRTACAARTTSRWRRTSPPCASWASRPKPSRCRAGSTSPATRRRTTHRRDALPRFAHDTRCDTHGTRIAMRDT